MKTSTCLLLTISLTCMISCLGSDSRGSVEVQHAFGEDASSNQPHPDDASSVDGGSDASPPPARTDGSPNSEEPASGTVPEPRWPGVASVSDSELEFYARFMITASPDSPGSSSGAVVMSLDFRSVDPLPEGGPAGATIAFQFTPEEACSVFDGTEWVRPQDAGEIGIVYPRARDGQWVARVASSMQMQRLPHNQFDATIVLSNQREVFQETQGAEAAPSAAVNISGPFSVHCSVYSSGREPSLIEDTRFESEFCQNFLAETGLSVAPNP
jgi:hypothetical protein